MNTRNIIDSFALENFDFELVEDIKVELLSDGFDIILDESVNIVFSLDQSDFFDFDLDLIPSINEDIPSLPKPPQIPDNVIPYTEDYLTTENDYLLITEDGVNLVY